MANPMSMSGCEEWLWHGYGTGDTGSDQPSIPYVMGLSSWPHRNSDFIAASIACSIVWLIALVILCKSVVPQKTQQPTRPGGPGGSNSSLFQLYLSG